MSERSAFPLTILKPPPQPFVAAAVIVHVGWRHEPPALAGISHYLEHVHYLGSRRYPDPDAVTARYGVEIGGPTLAETTTFGFVSLREDFFAVLPVLLDMVFHPRFDPTAVARERQHADAGVSPSDYTPWEWVEVKADDLLFGTETLESLGTPRSMAAITLDDLKTWQRRYYHWGNSHLVVAGEVDAAALQDAILAAAGPSQGERPQVVRRTHQQRWYYEQRPNVGNPELFVGFRFPAQEDLVPYHLLSILLGNYAASPAFRSLRRDAPVAYMHASSLRVLSTEGRFGLYVGMAQAGKETPTWERVVSVLQTMKRRPVSEETLAWAKRVFRINLLRRAAMPMQAIRFRRAWGQWGKPFRGWQALEEEASRVTAEDLQRLAASLFSQEQAFLAMVGPSPAPDLAAWLAMLD